MKTYLKKRHVITKNTSFFIVHRNNGTTWFSVKSTQTRGRRYSTCFTSSPANHGTSWDDALPLRNRTVLKRLQLVGTSGISHCRRRRSPCYPKGQNITDHRVILRTWNITDHCVILRGKISQMNYFVIPSHPKIAEISQIILQRNLKHARVQIFLLNLYWTIVFLSKWTSFSWKYTFTSFVPSQPYYERRLR